MHGGREQWPLLALLFTASLGGLLACLLFQKKSSRSPDQRAYFFRTKAWTANVKLGLTQRPVYFWFPAAAISPAVVQPGREVFLGTRCLHVNYHNAFYSRKKTLLSVSVFWWLKEGWCPPFLPVPWFLYITVSDSDCNTDCFAWS